MAVLMKELVFPACRLIQKGALGVMFSCHARYSMEATWGTVKPADPFDPEEDVRKLNDIFVNKGDSYELIDILTKKSNVQRLELEALLKTMYAKDIVHELRHFYPNDRNMRHTILKILRPPYDFDAEEIQKAVAGLGTDEDVLIEVLCSRNNDEITQINEAYKKLYKVALEHDIADDTSGYFRRLLISLSNGHRQEQMDTNPDKANKDAAALYSAAGAKWTANKAEFNAILASQSYEQLRLICEEYKRLSGIGLDEAIRKGLTGYHGRAMEIIVKCAINKPAYFAEQIFKAVNGIHTDDRGLVRVVVTRSEVDLAQIKQEFEKKFKRTLESFLEDDSVDKYKKVLYTLVKE